MNKKELDYISKLIFNRTGVYNGWFYDDISRKDIADVLAKMIIKYLDHQWNKKTLTNK